MEIMHKILETMELSSKGKNVRLPIPETELENQIASVKYELLFP